MVKRGRKTLTAGTLAWLVFGASAAVTQTRTGNTKEPDQTTTETAKPAISTSAQASPTEPDPFNFADHTGYVSLFDGKTLSGWDGRPGIWRVEDGAIVGETTSEMYAAGTFPNSFLIYRAIEARNFDLKLEIKVEKGGGSGIQYRSRVGDLPGHAPSQGYPAEDERWVMTGPQADFWYPVSAEASGYSGQLYSQNTSLGIVVQRGQVVQSTETKQKQLVGMIGDPEKLGALVKDGEWNQYRIIAREGVMMHILNGQLMAVLIDDDPQSSNNAPGLIGLQVEGVPCKVSFRNLWLKKID